MSYSFSVTLYKCSVLFFLWVEFVAYHAVGSSSVIICKIIFWLAWYWNLVQYADCLCAAVLYLMHGINVPNFNVLLLTSNGSELNSVFLKMSFCLISKFHILRDETQVNISSIKSVLFGSWIYGRITCLPDIILCRVENVIPLFFSISQWSAVTGASL